MTERTTSITVVAGLALACLPFAAEAPLPDEFSSARMEAEAPGTYRPALMVPFGELQCLAENVYFEARGEVPEGQEAVAHVTLNRVGSSGFPNTICGVVYQIRPEDETCQFQWVCDGLPDRVRDESAWDRALAAAVRALAGGFDPTAGALYFHNAAYRPAWAERARARRIIGNHVFFRLDKRTPEVSLAAAEVR